MIPTNDNSNHSDNSTVTVGEWNKRPIHLTKTELSHRVRFGEDLNEYFDNTLLCAEDFQGAWYDEDDYNKFRDDVRESVETWRTEKNNKDCLSAIKAIRALYAEASKVDYILNEVSNPITSKHIKKLSKLISNDKGMGDAVGLEKKLVASIKADLYERRCAVQDVVHDIQSEKCHGLWDDDEMQAEIRESCLNYSQCSLLFSQLLASAQEGALMAQTQDTQPQQQQKRNIKKELRRKGTRINRREQTSKLHQSQRMVSAPNSYGLFLPHEKTYIYREIKSYLDQQSSV